MKTSSFSRVVSGHVALATAFDLYCPAKWWWRAILWLHGKPTSPHLRDDERRHIVADGFRFYAALYRFLSGLFFFVSAMVWFAGIFESARDAWYWTGAGVLTSAFLWLVSGVGFAGARAMRDNQASARLMLCAFMIGVVAWLSGLLAALSVVAQTQTVGNPTLNLLVTGFVWAFGVGSYTIEVLYLVAQTE